MSERPKPERRQSGQQALRKATRKRPVKAPTIPHLRALSALPDKRRQFVLAYCGLAGGDLAAWWQGAPAARLAGYSPASAKHIALELQGDASVRAAIDEVKAWLDRQNDDERRHMLDKLRAIAWDPKVHARTQIRAIELYLRAIGHLQEPGVQVGVGLVMPSGDDRRGAGATVEQISRVRAVMGLPAIDVTATEGAKGQKAIDSQIANRRPGPNGHARGAPTNTADDDERD